MKPDDISKLREALALSPDNDYLRLILIQALINHQSYEDALSECLTLLSKNPQHLQGKLHLATCYLGKSETGTAIIILEEIIDTHPSAEVYVLLAKAYLLEKDLLKATGFYQKAKELDSEIQDEQLDRELTLKGMESLPVEDDFAQQVEASIQPKSKDKVTFAEVGGMEKEKEEIRIKIIHPLQHADLYEAYGKKVGGGILLYGPPGCGKTHLAKATAGEIDSEFISVGINDILDMYIGNSERNLHQLFEKARTLSPCVLFFDEVDALGANRSDLRTSAGRNIINQFLSELDGIHGGNDGLLIMGATNAPWHLDPAFRRPGRFDRIIFVSPPDPESRKAITRVCLEKKPVEKVDFDKVAKQMKDFSGADIKAVIDWAVEEKIKEAMKLGSPSPITTQDLLKASKKIKPSTKEWFVTARNYALYANESGIYDEILEYLNIKK
ncbi:AAA family ATPase [Rapidithrix thailandica]|uniref:AAA family ATPase n=1 Tax=Rapidithrix thailandica TaxID=413964 RepID=A0AAW9SD14_9BACT